MEKFSNKNGIKRKLDSKNQIRVWLELDRVQNLRLELDSTRKKSTRPSPNEYEDWRDTTKQEALFQAQR